MCFSLFLAYALKTKMMQVTIWVSSEVFVLALFKNLLISSEICMQKKKKKVLFLFSFTLFTSLPSFIPWKVPNLEVICLRVSHFFGGVYFLFCKMDIIIVFLHSSELFRQSDGSVHLKINNIAQNIKVLLGKDFWN